MTRILGLALILALTMASTLPPCAWTLLSEKSQSKSATAVSKKKHKKEIDSTLNEKQDTEQILANLAQHYRRRD
jgi:hypothetical protein